MADDVGPQFDIPEVPQEEPAGEAPQGAQAPTGPEKAGQKLSNMQAARKFYGGFKDARAAGGGLIKAARAGQAAVKAASAAKNIALLANPYFWIILGCILAIGAIIVVVAVIVYMSGNAGITKHQGFDKNSTSDKEAAAKLAASDKTVGERGIGILNELKSTAVGELTKQIFNYTFKAKTAENTNIQRAQAAEPVDEQLNKLALQLQSDSQAMSTLAGSSEIRKQIDRINSDVGALQDYYQSKTGTVPAEISTPAAEIKSQLDNLAIYTYTGAPIDVGGNSVFLAKKRPIQLNPADAQKLLDIQDPNYSGVEPDIRTIRLLVYLIENPHLQGTTPTAWEHLRVSKIFQDDPTNKEATVTEEKSYASAHTNGQAVDISEVGYVTCKRRIRISSGGIRKKPCFVSYQTPYRPFGRTANIDGEFYRDVISNIDYQTIKDELGLENISGGNLENVAYQVGIAALLEEMGIAPGFAKGEISKSLIAESYLAQASGVSTDEIHSILQENPETKDAKTALGRAIMAKQLGLPVGSIRGNNFDEVVKSTGLAYEKQTFDLEYTTWNGKVNNDDLGRAVLEKNFDSSDEAKVKAQIQNSPGAADHTLYLADGKTQDYLSGKNSYSSFVNDVGGSYLYNLTATYKENGMDRALGFPPGTMAALVQGDVTAQVRIGSIVLSRAFGLNDPNANFYADANNLKINLGHADTTHLQFQISVEDLALIISTDDPNLRNQALQRVANTQWEAMRNSYIDNKIQTALEKNHLNINLSFQQILDATKDSNKRDAFLASLGDQVLAEIFRKNAPTINHYTLTTQDLDDAKNNRWWSVAYRVGGAKLEDILDLPPNTLQPIFEGTVSPQVGMANAGIYKLSEAIGIDLTGVKVDESWFGSSSLKENFGRAAVENRGLIKGSFNGSIDEVISKNGAAKVASVFGLTESELTMLRMGEVSATTVQAQEKLARQAVILGTSADNLQKFIQGKDSIDASVISKDVGKSRVTDVFASDENITAVLDALYDGFDLNIPADAKVNDLIKNAIRGESVSTQDMTTAFGQLYGRKIDKALGIDETINFNGRDMGFAEVLLTDPRNADVHLVEFGATRLAESIIPDSPNNKYNASDLRKTLVSTFKDLYQNGTISEDTELLFIGTVADTIQRTTNIADNADARTLARGDWQKGAQYIGYAQLSRFAAEAFHNNNHPPDPALYSYESIKMMFEGDVIAAQNAYGEIAMTPHGTTTPDQAYRETIDRTRNEARNRLAFMISDLQLKQVDPNIPAGTTEAFATGDTAMQQDVALEYASKTIKVGGKSLYEWGINAQVLREMADGIDVNDTNAQNAIQSALENVFHTQLPEGTVSAIVAYVNTQDLSQIKNVAQTWAIDRVGGYLDRQLGWNSGTSKMLYDTYTDYKAGKLGNIGKNDLIVLVFDRSGLGKAMDKALGLPSGFSGAILQGALTGNWIGLGYAIVGWAMSWKCDNAQQMAQYNVREILKEILEAPDRPTQIATFGKGIDENTVNYLYGINPGDFLLDEDKPADGNTANVTLVDRVTAKFGKLTAISRQGLWAGDPNIFWNHIHVGY